MIRQHFCFGFAVLLALGGMPVAVSQAGHFLQDDGSAAWIRSDDPIDLAAHFDETRTTQFRVRLPAAGAGELHIQTLGSVSVRLQGTVIFNELVGEDERGVEARISLPAQTGSGWLEFLVRNDAGPAAIWASSASLGVHSNAGDWQTLAQGGQWKASRRLFDLPIPELSRRFENPWRAAVSLPVLSLWFFLPLLWVVWRERAIPQILRSSNVRWLLMGLWCALAIHNISRLPAYLGFDVGFHVEYIAWLLEHGRLPLASDGWQGFQAPGFYLLAAGLFRVFSLFMSDSTALQLLRIIPLLCGLAQIEIVYRGLRAVFREQDGLVSVCTCMIGFLPVSIYMSQYLSNEPLAALLGSLLILRLTLVLGEAQRIGRTRELVWMGAILGAAILTKVSALLLVPAALVCIIWAGLRNEFSRQRIGGQLAVFAASTLLICGWYFIRNWISLGQPIVLASADVQWWQAPGFRDLGQVFRFGRVLHHPIMAGLHSLGDAIYSTLWLDGQLSSAIAYDARPPWNYRFVLSCAVLGLLPSGLILAGAVRTLWRRRPAGVLGVALGLLFLAAILQQFLALPIYSTAKASYALSLLPALGLLLASGLEAIRGFPALFRAICGFMVAYAALSYLGYFVQTPA